MACKLIHCRMRSSDCLLKNVVLATEYSGDGYKCLTQLPSKFVRDHLDNNDLLGMICTLDEQSVRPEPFTLQVLKDLRDTLISDDRGSFSNADVSERTRHQKLVKAFLDCGGVEVVLRLVMTTSLLPPHAAAVEETPNVLNMKGLCLEILCQLCVADASVAKTLCVRDDVLHYLFVLMHWTQTSYHACELVEHFLLYKKEPFNLNTIPNLSELVESLSDTQLANFCRIMAVAISDLDMYDNKSSLYAQNKQKRSKDFIPIRDINQDTLMNIPNLLASLVRVACRKPYIPRYPSCIGEIDHWMQWIEVQITSDNSDAEQDDGEHYVPAPLLEPQQEPGLQLVFDLTNRVEVVYVIGLLLIGKQRKKVQKMLADLRLVPELSELFDEFVWRSSDASNQNLLGHNNGCECSPEVALKIQFLRLVHSFCDHSEYKHLMLTESEYDELKKIQEAHNGETDVQDEDKLENMSRDLMCRGDQGMLTKIVEVMKKESTSSTFRFWLSRAVESYLRGPTYYADQIFLIRRGLLQHVASNLINNEIRQKEIRQSSFDLLGELVKFNVEALRQFDKVVNSEQKFEKLAGIINKSLVDSNMFIRSLILSLEHFVKDGRHEEYACKECRLLAYIIDVRQRIAYLYKLLNLINVQSLTQENVSCLNTTLVFLMFAHMKGEMHNYLEALKEKSETCTSPDQGNDLMQNFRELLLFWQEHYLHKDKDCSALEKSSRISFEYWKETVSVLVNNDRKSVLSLVHYIPEERCTRNS